MPEDRLDRLADLVQALRERGGESAESKERIVERHEEYLERGGAGGSTAAVDGRTLGPFVLRREIGRGGMGVVYEAYDPTLFRAVAVKVLPAHLTLRQSVVERFQREAGAVARLQHPGIVTVHRVEREGDTHFFAMELVQGPSLAQVITALLAEGRSAQVLARALGGPAPGPSVRFLHLAVDIVARVADALQHAHESGVIHRDVKPSNILMRPDGSPVLTDFGLAQIDDGENLTLTGELAGTPSYISPEQAMGRRIPLDARTDVFSLGVTLYELLTLEKPFDGTTTQHVLEKIIAKEPRDPRRIATDIPEDLAAIVFKALEKDRDRKYDPARAFADDLRAFAAHMPVKARHAPLTTRVARFLRREPLKAAFVAVLALGTPALAGLGGFLLAKRDAISIGEKEIAFERRDRLLAEVLLKRVMEPARAERAVDEALAIAPDDVELLAAKGWIVAARLASPPSSLAWVDGLGAKGETRTLQWLRVLLLNADGEHVRAKAIQERLGAPATSFEHVLHGLSIAHTPPLNREHCRQALDPFENAILQAERPRRFFYYALLQFALMAEESQRAIPYAEAAVVHWPDDVESWLYAAWIHDKAAPALAERDLRAALTLDPKCAQALQTLGRRAFDAGDVAEGVPLLQRAVALDPKSYIARLRLSKHALKRRDLDELRRQLEQWEAAAWNDPMSLTALAEFRIVEPMPRSLQDAGACERVLARAVELKGDDPKTPWWFAKWRADAGRFAEALALAERAIQKPDHSVPSDESHASRRAYLDWLRSRVETDSRPASATEAAGKR